MSSSTATSMVTPAETKALLGALQQHIGSYLGQLTYGDHPPELYEPIRYIMELGGKRVRPLLVLLAYHLYKEDVESALPAAAAIEVFHNFTLMHDDIMDSAPLRRGLPTVHHKWNSNVAILSGDVMLVNAYQLLAQAPVADLRPLLQLFNEAAVAVCEGQQLDMNFETQGAVTAEQYLDMISKKTAYLVGHALQAGAVVAGASNKESHALFQIGMDMGIGFQLIDDVLDVFGAPDKVGKRPGGDILANKKTYLLISALELAQGSTRQHLAHWLAQPLGTDDDAKVAAVTTIYRQLDIENRARQLANRHFHRAFDTLKTIPGNAPAKAALTALFQQLVVRES